ncbi:hypothetical protein AM1BK_07060 [Neobacillus kokaensis]|uniref:Uncharacterized protein n=1 Tax=Neobacillus kokaensis TaxID=2759023 RepID=A0ABQ3MWW5_9BACI|nr:hypothetical protein AM1BK_07060 [Neobacillus kokaensis]
MLGSIFGTALEAGIIGAACIGGQGICIGMPPYGGQNPGPGIIGVIGTQ